jgi:small-conductance mechanosensitive channel
MTRWLSSPYCAAGVGLVVAFVLFLPLLIAHVRNVRSSRSIAALNALTVLVLVCAIPSVWFFTGAVALWLSATVFAMLDRRSDVSQVQVGYVAQVRRALLMLASFGFVIFFWGGMSTGLGVFRNPTECWIAAGYALVGVACASGRQRWIAGIAAVVAVAGSLYGYHENDAWRVRLERIRAEHPPKTAPQTETTNGAHAPSGR